MRLLKKVYRLIADVLKEFSEDNGALVSAGMAFFGLLSLIPLLLLAVAALGYAIGSERAFESVVGLVRQYLPTASSELRENLYAIRRSSGVVGGLGLLGLLWTGSQMFVILQLAMNIALDVNRKPGFVITRLRALGMVLLAGALFAASIALTWTIGALRAFDIAVFGLRGLKFDPFWDFVLSLLPIIVSMAMFFLIYKYLPTIEMGVVGPLIAGITAGALFEVAKWGFGLYVANFGNFSAVYGSIGGVVILMLWIYYVSLITVLGAEVASVYRKHEKTANTGGVTG